MNKKKEFIEKLIEMNTESLEIKLKKNAYRQFSNINFIEKLNKMFTNLKSLGDTHIEIHRGVGICSCNKNKDIMLFVGNSSRNYFALSFREDESSYYGFNKTCKDILLNKPTLLNTFHYFSIKPKETIEYNTYKENSKPLSEYRDLCSKEFCKMSHIELWLAEYKDIYTKAVNAIKKHDKGPKSDPVKILLNKEFELLYGKLKILSILYRKEDYFKIQLKEYNVIKDSISGRKAWFKYHNEHQYEYKLFSSMFYDNRELTHYQLKVDHLTLNTEDFKHTLEFIELIEDNMSIEVVGTIKSLKDLEIIEKTESRSSSKRREIVLSIDDFYSSEYLITFSEGRAEHLENVHEGQYVKVLARLIGGEWKNSEGKKEFYNSLYGWKIEELNRIPNNEKYSKEIEQYYKYTMIPPI